MLMHSEQNNTKYNVLRKSKSWYNYKWWDEIEISTNKYKYEEREQKTNWSNNRPVLITEEINTLVL